jgi:hypothetical protein
MKASTLKILACIFMLIDHIGYVLFPKVIILRIIGRLAFPIFAYFIAEGYRRTKDLTGYLGRLLLFAMISVIPFSEAFKSYYFNIFFTLAMGLYSLYIYDKYKKFIYVVLIGLLCQLLHTDYGLYGVLLVFFFNYHHEDFKKMSRDVILLTIIAQGIQGFINYYYFHRNPVFTLLIQPLCLFSLILIRYYNGERGLKLKYLFYAFYPVHLIVLILISQLKI